MQQWDHVYSSPCSPLDLGGVDFCDFFLLFLLLLDVKLRCVKEMLYHYDTYPTYVIFCFVVLFCLVSCVFFFFFSSPSFVAQVHLLNAQCSGNQLKSAWHSSWPQTEISCLISLNAEITELSHHRSLAQHRSCPLPMQLRPAPLPPNVKALLFWTFLETTNTASSQWDLLPSEVTFEILPTSSHWTAPKTFPFLL